MKPKLTVEAFTDWAATKPPEETYNWASNDTCACAQYARYLGMTSVWKERHHPRSTHSNSARTFFREIDDLAGDVTGDDIRPARFSELVASLRTL